MEERFWEKVRKTNKCWLWEAYIMPNGYGTFNQRTSKGWRYNYAHRVSYMIHFGEIPRGFCVLHKCDVRHCVRPDHLFIGTCADNSADMVAKKRQRVGETVTNSKLTNKEVLKIRKLYAQGWRQRDFLPMGISRTAIHRIVNFVYWKHLGV